MNPLLMAPVTAGNSNNSSTYLLLGFVIWVILIIALRAFFLWYWKINTIVKNQEKTNLMLKKYIESKGIEFTDDEKARLKS
jgi:hypothetical protein